ncbi:MAG: hypothetical protein IPF72_13925 [Chitinophagaceae bacterium]|nr:hypothetical protein [Chitinophagaceae bacterium]
MKINSFKIFILTLAVFFCPNLKAQSFPDLLKTLNNEYGQEKLYLQFDRTHYNSGETIWFKAYLFAGNLPSLISKTLYTELTDAKGKILQRIISPVMMSGAAGSIDIPSDVSGTVIVRSYTKWMLNFDSSFLFTKALSVISPQKPAEKNAIKSSVRTNTITANSSFVVQFFPEGGDLVQGVESRIAFKATDQKGMPVNITGDIYDSKGNSVTTFASLYDGMGIFLLEPEAGVQYKAAWKGRQGQINETPLVPAKQTGIVLEAGHQGGQIQFKIKRPADVPEYPFVYVVAQINQQVLYRTKAYIDKTQSAKGIIPTENSPAGIVQITVFSPDEKPLAERIIFANLIDYSFNTDLVRSVADTGRRKKNSIQIDLPDTIPCNLSIAVTDAELNPGLAGDNIFSRLLLTDDIKGYVHNPAYYFSGDADSVADHLDLVMMTNGWRRFKWQDALTGRYPEIKYLPENFISIDGQVKGLNQTTLAGKEINGILEFKDKRREFLITPVQPDGKFSFSGMIFYDTAKLFYQFNKDKNKTLTSRANFVIKNNLLRGPLQTGNPLIPDLSLPDDVSISKIIETRLMQLSDIEFQKSKTLKTIEVTTKILTQKDLLDKEYTSGYFSDDPNRHSRTILPEDDPAFLSSQNLFSYLQGRIAGLQISVNGNDATITWRGIPTSLFVDEIPQSSISLNPPGQLIEDPSYMLSLPMSEIEMVKIFDPPFFGAGSVSYGGQGGAISVYLKRATVNSQLSKGLDYLAIPGYSPVREFYSPDYSIADQTNIPDYRSTLYWNPFVVTGKNQQQITLSFYNNDITKKIKIIIEGCNENGKLTRVEKIFE